MTSPFHREPRLVGRRVLLGYGVSGMFLLPALLQASMAEAASSKAPKPAPMGKRVVPLVMLDPGHGGKDPGAIGVSGTYEKNISLAAAHELKRQLDASGRYRVELTRSRDVFVPLDERVARAQGKGAALFVSMHADALRDSGVRGASVYTLANSASDAQTAALAARENSADRFGGPGFRDTPPEVARILSSLVRQETRAGSTRLAHSMVGSLDQEVPLLVNPSRHAGFVVLKAADIPSVLVEMGFMSNPRDEAELRKPGHRARVANAMAKAVDAYFLAQAGITRTSL
jgi:N-acetylmuramoyl-L-alanine amidase